MKVKSALRVFEVLEYFDEIKRDASLSEIARRLGYPFSSTSGLLKSMVDVGYLTQTHKQYRPSLRVALLGSWVASDIAPEASVLKMMEWVGAQCSQTIVLAVPEPVQVRYIRVVPATSTMRMYVSPGALRPYPTSGLGRLFLSKMPDEKIVEVVHIYNKYQAKESGQLNPETICREILSIRKEGVSVSMDQVSPGEGVVAIHLPSQAPKFPLAIGIGGSSQLIREKQNQFKELLQDAVKIFCPAGA